VTLADVLRREMSSFSEALASIPVPPRPERKSAGSDWIDQVFRTMGDSMGVPGRLTQPYKEHATVYRAINAFGRNIARVPFEFFRKGSDDVDEDHPVNRLFMRPNALMRGTQLIEALALDLEAFGNGLWWNGPLVRATGAGVRIPASIRRLDPRRTKIRLDSNDEPERYDFSVNGQTIKIPAEEVTHFKFWNPFDEAWGMSWTDPAEGEFTADWMAQAWNRKFFLRGADAGTLLVPKGDFNISEPAAERIRQSWINKHQGYERAHTPDILPTGLEVVKTAMGQKEMDFVAGRRYSRENTLSASGVPPAIAGILEYANYANMIPQLRIFYHLEVMPRMQYIESVIQADWLDRFKLPLEGYFKVEAINSLIDELGEKTQTAERLWQMGVPLEILNDRFDLGLDLDGIVGADKAFIKSFVVPMEQLLNPAASVYIDPAEPAPGKPAADPNADPNAQDELDQAPPAPKPRRSMVTSVVREAIWRSVIAAVHPLELKMESRWRGHLASLRDEVLKNLRGPAGKSLRGGVRREFKDPNAVGFNLDNANADSVISLEPVWRAAMMTGADTVSQQLGVRINFSLQDPRILKMLADRRQDIRGVNERMLSDLHEALSEALAENATERDLEQVVLDFFGGERANARTVGRTETFSAFSGGRFEAMTEAGVRKHTWITSRDTRVRDDHADMEGDSVPVGEFFRYGMRYPLDPAAPAGQTINCRCATMPEVA
jgi:HK97 family phage portal protein